MEWGQLARLSRHLGWPGLAGLVGSKLTSACFGKRVLRWAKMEIIWGKVFVWIATFVVTARVHVSLRELGSRFPEVIEMIMKSGLWLDLGLDVALKLCLHERFHIWELGSVYPTDSVMWDEKSNLNYSFRINHHSSTDFQHNNVSPNFRSPIVELPPRKPIIQTSFSMSVKTLPGRGARVPYREKSLIQCVE